MNAFYEPFAHAQKKPLVVPTPPLVECIAYIVFQSGNLAAGKGYDYVSTRPDYPRGVRSEMDLDLGGWSRGMTWPACKHVPCHIAGMLALSCWKRKLFQTF